MGKKPTTLWKPDDAEDADIEMATKGYNICSAGLCTEIVGNPGDRCTTHLKDGINIHRSPSNHLIF